MNHQTEQTIQPLVFYTQGGQLVAVREAAASDTELLTKLLLQLSARTCRLRYMSLRHFSPKAVWEEAARMTRGDPLEHTTLVATIQPNEHDEAVAVAELVRDPQDLTLGEIALLVRDDEQQQGIGTFLIRHLVNVAQRNGITRLSASMLAENRAMLRLIRELRLPYTASTSYGETQVLVSIPSRSVQSNAPTSNCCVPRSAIIVQH